MEKIRISCLAIALLFTSVLHAIDFSNVVIQQMDDVYKFIEGKDGALERVEHTNATTFRARRGPAHAVAGAYYDDFIKINSTSGGEVEYKASIRKDIFFSDSKMCWITVDLKKEGATGKATFKRTFTKPELFSKHMFWEVYDMDASVVTFEFPKSMASRFSIVPKNIPEGKMTVSRTESGNKVKLTYTLTDVKSPGLEEGAPSRNVTSPQLLILGHYPNAQEVYRYLHGYLPENDPEGAAVERMAKEVTAGCNSEREKIAAINTFVHGNIRYVAVEHGEFGHRPDLPSSVLSKRYGDCKGSAGLLRAMLRAAGIDARYVWVGTNVIGETWSECPNVSTGNHMIAAAVTGDSLLFIDGTATYNPIGLIPSSYQGREVLVEDTPEKCIVATVPLAPPSQNSLVSHLEGNLLETGVIDVTGEVSMTGCLHAGFRELNESVPPAKRKDMSGRMFTNMLNGLRLSDNHVAVITDSLTTIKGSGKVSGSITPGGDHVYLDLNPMSDLKNLRFDLKNRTQPGQLSFRSLRQAELAINLHEGLRVTETPADVDIENEWIKGSVTTEIGNGGGRITRRLDVTVKETSIPLDQIKRYNDDLNRLIRACSAKIEINKIK